MARASPRRRGQTAFHLRLTRTGRNVVRQANDLIPPLDAELGTAASQAQRHQLIAQLKLIAQTLGLDPNCTPTGPPVSAS